MRQVKAFSLILGLLPALALAQPSVTTDSVVAAESPSVPVSVPVTQIRAYFTPGHTVETAITDEIDAAQNTIRVQAYSFTNPLIVQALADARLRGVDVIVVLDKSNRTQRSSVAELAQRAGIPTLIDDRHAIAHNKIMIIDDRIVITGSYNFSRAAEKSNAENLVIIESAPIARKYQQNWQKHHQHSKPFVAGQQTP
ncbi:MAG: phospholipase D family protein [Rhodocyclaceae bacterium]|nr:phospholipase D family protein [Rhodocyclaceae bacterium]